MKPDDNESSIHRRDRIRAVKDAYDGPKLPSSGSTWDECRKHPQPVRLERTAGPCQLCQHPGTYEASAAIERMGLL